MVKTLGKHVIMFSHRKLTADKMIEVCDFYRDINDLKDEELDEFTHIFEKR